jgi:hypothetical protein
MERKLGPLSRAVMAGALGLALFVPATASAASTKPAVKTGGVADVTITSATLKGSVDPNGAATTYFFQIGTTSLYGANTAAVAAGSGSSPKAVTTPVGALAAATVYHYRIVAQNRNGLVKGGDRTFKTKPQPLGVTLAANPNPVAFGSPVTLAGQLTGTGNAGRQVVLQSNPFPYTQGFQNAANVQVTDAAGNFSFALLSVPLNTQFRVLMPAKPEVVSPIVSLGVAVRLTTHVSRHRVVRGSRVRFSGTVRPASDGARILFQRKKGSRWVQVSHTFARGTGTSSHYSKHVRIGRGGTYRVLVQLSGSFVGSEGTHMHLRTRR